MLIRLRTIFECVLRFLFSCSNVLLLELDLTKTSIQNFHSDLLLPSSECDVVNASENVVNIFEYLAFKSCYSS